jgi:hypothetical protein
LPARSSVVGDREHAVVARSERVSADRACERERVDAEETGRLAEYSLTRPRGSAVAGSALTADSSSSMITTRLRRRRRPKAGRFHAGIVCRGPVPRRRAIMDLSATFIELTGDSHWSMGPS